MRIAHKETTELFEGCEALEWNAEDWDLVNPLGNISAYDCGYGKIDYNNDGKKKLFTAQLTLTNGLLQQVIRQTMRRNRS